MTQNMPVAVVKIDVRRDCQQPIATSRDVPGLFVTGKDDVELFDRVVRAIKLLYKANHAMEIDVSPVAGVANFPTAKLSLSDRYAIQAAA